MKVEKVNGNYRQKAPASFKGGAVKLADQITNALPQHKILKKMENLQWMKGEFGSIFITALGTGLVAPIFIGFNPFVKAPKDATKEQKDEVTNTKIYTAMRQPISAVLALIFQLSALKPIDIALDEMMNNPKYSKNFSLHVDQSALNSNSYLQRQVAKELKKEGIKKPSLLKGFTEGFSKIKQERKDFTKLVKERVDAKAEQQLQNLADNFRNTGKIKIDKRYLDNPTLAQLVNKQIDEYIADANSFKIKPEGLEFYTKRAKTLINNEDHIREIFKDIPYEKIALTKDTKELKQLYENTDAILKKALLKETNPEIQILIREILEKPDEIRASRVARTLERIQTIKDACNGHYSPGAYLNSMLKRNEELDKTIVKLKLNKIENPSKATEKTVNDAIKRLINNCKFKPTDNLLKSILHDTATFDSNEEKLSKKVHKDITKLYKKFVAKKYTAPNQIAKILISVCITLPITCNALNWVYPRFMEIVFPRISGAKKEGGDK